MCILSWVHSRPLMSGKGGFSIVPKATCRPVNGIAAERKIQPTFKSGAMKTAGFGQRWAQGPLGQRIFEPLIFRSWTVEMQSEW